MMTNRVKGSNTLAGGTHFHGTRYCAMSQVPQALRSARRSKGQAQRGWKLLMAHDLIIFGDLQNNAAKTSKGQIITDRLDLIEHGQWGTHTMGTVQAC
jgi:hypothetical protein